MNITIFQFRAWLEKWYGIKALGDADDIAKKAKEVIIED